MNWNVDGLLSKLNDPEFIDFLKSFSVICLTETHLQYFDNENFLPDFECFVSPAQKLSLRGRYSGGTMCLISRTISRFFRIIPVSFENILTFRIDKELFKTTCDIFLLVVYIPPMGSPFYENRDTGNGIDILDDCLSQIEDRYGDVHLMLCGDFNARTGSLNTRCDSFLPNVRNEVYGSERSSGDNVVNTFGRSFLSLCLAYGLRIVNGITLRHSDKLTYISENGASVIDYLVVSDDLLRYCVSLNVGESTCSPHLPMEANFTCNVSDAVRNDSIFVEKIVWNKNAEEIYKEKVCTALEVARIDEVLSTQDVHTTVKTLTDCMTSAACFLKKSFRQSSSRKGYRWFDKECHEFKKNVRQKLRKFQSTRDREDRSVYTRSRNEYKMLLRRKKSSFKASVTLRLSDSISDSETFWKTLKMLQCKRNYVCPIAIEVWAEHFREIYAENESSLMPVYSNIRATVELDCDSDCLNDPIVMDEVRESIKRLKGGKAGGGDEVLAEMIKCSSHILIPYFVRLFNAVLDTGNFPRQWCESTIIPIPKKGDRTNPDNYRGITLTSVFSKVFLHVVQNRIDRWLDLSEIIVEEQAGFRKGYSTVDNIFVLHGIVEKYLSQKKKLYAAFIDFRKAFDSVNRSSLWIVLEKYGFTGKICKVLRSMYENVQCCIRSGNVTSDFFPCFRGLKQGCKCSPKIFSIVINTLASEVKDKCKHGIQLMPNTPEISILLFADDIVLLSGTVIGLQNQIDTLQLASSRLGLEVNLQKTKVMIFRKGGHIAAHERWFINGNVLEVVNDYKYLGYKFTTKMSSNIAMVELASRGKAAAVQINKMLKRLSYVVPDLYFKIFECQVQPILLYASEVWGLSKCNVIETVHLYSLKQFMNVHVKTPNVMIYGDTGRYPLSINATMRLAKFWLKVLRMDEDRLPKRVYKMLMKSIDCCDNWAKKVRTMLRENDLEHFWESQEVQSESSFLRRLRDSLVDKFREQWLNDLHNSERYSIYRQFKVTFGLENYLYMIDKKVFRESLIKFRFGISNLFIHKHRFEAIDHFLCPLCQEEDENEYHVLIRCQAVNDLRVKYLVPHIKDDVNLFTYFIGADEQTALRAVCTYLYHVMKRRDDAILLSNQV